MWRVTIRLFNERVNMTQAVVLFAHGSRNAAWREPFEAIANKVRAQTAARVELAFLELMQPSLPDVLRQLAADGALHISVVPLFFGLGNHVANDLTALIAAFAAECPAVRVQVAPPLGQSESVLQAMADYAVLNSTPNQP
ncbi:MAG: sirohydrochlorin chelatase [Formosimonas sp.]